MATAQNLVVNILGNASQLSRTAKQAQSDVKQLERRVTASVGGIVRQFAGLAGIAGLSVFVRESFRTIDATSKLADELGMTTQALQRYSHAAQLTGTNNETVIKGLQRLSRRLGEAQSGYGQGVKGLARLGLTARDVSGTLDQSFEHIAEAIKNIADPAQQAAAAYELFGRQGQEMLSLLKSGKEGIQQMGAEAERLGITFGRLDGAKIEKANDAMLRLKQSVKAAGQTIAIELAPLITAVSGHVVEGVRHFQQWAGSAVRLGAAIGGAAAALKLIRLAQDAIIKRQAILQALSGPKGWATLAAGAAVAAGAYVAVDRALESLNKTTVESRRNIEEQAEAARRAKAAFEAIGEGARSSKQSIDDHLAAAARARAELAALQQMPVDRWRDDAAHADKMADATRRVGDATRAARAEALKFTEQFKDGATKIREELAKLDQAVRGGGMAGGDPHEAAQRAIIDRHTGVFSEIKSARAELARLKGEATETEQKLRDMLAAGAPADEVERLRRLWEQRDALKEQAEQQQAWNDKLAQGSADLDALAARLKEGLKSDSDRLRDELEQIKLLWQSGRLTRDQAGQLSAQARQKFLDKQAKPERVAESRPNTLLEARSREGIEAFNRLFRPGAEGSKKPEDQQVDLLIKIERLQSRLLTLQQQQGRPIQLGRG